MCVCKCSCASVCASVFLSEPFLSQQFSKETSTEPRRLRDSMYNETASSTQPSAEQSEAEHFLAFISAVSEIEERDLGSTTKQDAIDIGVIPDTWD